MKKIIYVVIAVIAGLFIWQCVKFEYDNCDYIPEIRLPEVCFPENPQLKRQISEMVADLRDDEVPGSGIYIVRISYGEGSLGYENRNKININIEWYKSTDYDNRIFCGYFTDNNRTFIIHTYRLPVQIISPGKSWRTFKPEPFFPLFGKNIKWTREFVIESGKYSLVKASRWEFNEKIYQESWDSFRAEQGRIWDSILAIPGFFDEDVVEEFSESESKQ